MLIFHNYDGCEVFKYSCHFKPTGLVFSQYSYVESLFKVLVVDLTLGASNFVLFYKFSLRRLVYYYLQRIPRYQLSDWNVLSHCTFFDTSCNCFPINSIQNYCVKIVQKTSKKLHQYMAPKREGLHAKEAGQSIIVFFRTRIMMSTSSCCVLCRREIIMA